MHDWAHCVRGREVTFGIGFENDLPQSTTRHSLSVVAGERGVTLLGAALARSRRMARSMGRVHPSRRCFRTPQDEVGIFTG